MFEADHGILRVMCKRDMIDIPIESIYYIESDGRKLNIHRSDEICITIYGKLNDMEQVLEKAWQKQASKQVSAVPPELSGGRTAYSGSVSGISAGTGQEDFNHP